MYKLIAVDFDDTILTSDKRITKTSKKYLMDLKSKGYYIVGVTGRNLNSVLDIGESEIFNYYVLNNGSDLYDIDNNSIENIYSIDRRIVDDIVTKYLPMARRIDCCSTSNYLYFADNETVTNKSFIIKINSLNEINESISRMNIFMKDINDIDKLKSLINSIKDIDCFIMQDSTNDNRWLVVMPKGVNKSSALSVLCNRLNMTLEDVIFFGDGLNDIELMQNSGFGVAMGNALDEVKEVADDITITNDEDGVIKYLSKILK